MKKRIASICIWLALIGLFYFLFSTQQSQAIKVDLAVFQSALEDGAVTSISFDGANLNYTLAGSSEHYVTAATLDEQTYEKINAAGIPITWDLPTPYGSMLITTIVPLFVLLAFLFYFIRRSSKGNNHIMGLSKSRARLVEHSDVTFENVGACAEAKEQLQDVLSFLKHPDEWRKNGVRLPRGILLEGPPGCGKTLLARAVAGETNAKFFSVAASEFVELFVGVGAARVRDLFESAKKEGPAVIFIDELDAVGRRRGSGLGPGHDEREQTLNQLLVCMDGLETDDTIVVLAATNRTDILDRALLRPGRFDRKVRIAKLDAEERLQVLQIHTKSKPLAEDIDLRTIAAITDGYTGADLESVANEAALQAMRRSLATQTAPTLCAEDFNNALALLQRQSAKYDHIDQVLIESSTQLAEPLIPASIRVELRDDSVIVGQIIWADAALLKMETTDGSILIPKIQIKSIQSIAPSGGLTAEAVLPS